MAEALEGPLGREHSSMVMESWGGRASMAGGFQGLKRRLKRKRNHGIRKGKGRKKGETKKEKRGGRSFLPSLHLSPARRRATRTSLSV